MDIIVASMFGEKMKKVLGRRDLYTGRHFLPTNQAQVCTRARAVRPNGCAFAHARSVNNKKTVDL